MLDARHREWISALPALGTRDGIKVDKTKIVPYVYRHCYAQRHADAGVPIDVLAELLDHRSYSVTRRYYRIGEDRRRAAVDTVTALSFDRHGKRIWRDAHTLLESERARHAVGEVAVPYGTCTEPTNVQAGGGACPVRFRCAGCDHFRTNVAFLPDLQAHLDDLLRTRERQSHRCGVDQEGHECHGRGRARSRDACEEAVLWAIARRACCSLHRCVGTHPGQPQSQLVVATGTSVGLSTGLQRYRPVRLAPCLTSIAIN